MVLLSGVTKLGSVKSNKVNTNKTKQIRRLPPRVQREAAEASGKVTHAHHSHCGRVHHAVHPMPSTFSR